MSITPARALTQLAGSGLLEMPAAAFSARPAIGPTPLAPVPSPGALALLGIGTLAFLSRRRRI
jgi:hypothetical protein